VISPFAALVIGGSVELLAERFTMFAMPGLQQLCYLVPGAGGELEPGSRRANWVWYVNTAESNLPWLLTGNSGRRFDHLVPKGELTTDAISRLQGRDRLPPQFAELVEQVRMASFPGC
jgi:hypothetical protein